MFNENIDIWHFTAYNVHCLNDPIPQVCLQPPPPPPPHTHTRKMNNVNSGNVREFVQIIYTCTTIMQAFILNFIIMIIMSKCFKKAKICKWLEIPYSFLPIDCCVRISAWSASAFIQWQWQYSVIDILIETAYILKLLYSWLFNGPSQHHHTTQT